ncbi:hypothetical protein [Celeribacter sp.]|uniref:hypothetical protein n=1 Tax=Celeribacter sp. TaxID=1890673 RepID=UPI003A8D66D9
MFLKWSLLALLVSAPALAQEMTPKAEYSAQMVALEASLDRQGTVDRGWRAHGEPVLYGALSAVTHTVHYRAYFEDCAAQTDCQRVDFLAKYDAASYTKDPDRLERLMAEHPGARVAYHVSEPVMIVQMSASLDPALSKKDIRQIVTSWSALLYDVNNDLYLPNITSN